MAEQTFYFEILTPDRNLFSGEAKVIYFPTACGYLGVLPGHADLVTQLASGVVTCVEVDGAEKKFFIAGGFAKMAEGTLTLLADVAESEVDIDFQRAARAKERAEKRIASAEADIDYARANASLQRALDRMRIAHRKVPA